MNDEYRFEIDEDADGNYIVSDDFTGVCGEGTTILDAIHIYADNLIEWAAEQEVEWFGGLV